MTCEEKICIFAFKSMCNESVIKNCEENIFLDCYSALASVQIHPLQSMTTILNNGFASVIVNQEVSQEEILHEILLMWDGLTILDLMTH